MITVAVQKGEYVYVYNEKNSRLFAEKGELCGFTSATVSIKRGDYVYTYNEKRSKISSHYVK